MDEVRLRQVLVNLVHNGVKFTHEGHVIVYVKRGEMENIDAKPRETSTTRRTTFSSSYSIVSSDVEMDMLEYIDMYCSGAVRLIFSVEDTGTNRFPIQPSVLHSTATFIDSTYANIQE